MKEMRFKNLEEYKKYFSSRSYSALDPEFSEQNQSLLKKMGAKGFDIDSNWVTVPASWKCPCCERGKKDIVKLDSNENLSGRLHLHHDHIKEMLKEKFTNTALSAKENNSNAESVNFVKRVSPALSAFPETLVCSDCNAADARAKKITGAPSEFSFSPRQIKSFIKNIKPHLKHEIDAEKAKEALSNALPAHETRLAIADQICKVAVSGEHWYEMPLNNQNQTKNDSTREMGNVYLEDKKRHLDTRDLFPRANAPKDIKKWRTKRQSTVSTEVTQQMIEQFLKVDNALDYESLQSDWECPCCKRERDQILRQGEGKSTLVFKTHGVETDEGGGSIKGRKAACTDCWEMISRMRPELEEKLGRNIGNDRFLLTIEKIQRFIKPKPHAKHEIDNEAYEEVLDEIVELLKEIQEKRELNALIKEKEFPAITAKPSQTTNDGFSFSDDSKLSNNDAKTAKEISLDAARKALQDIRKNRETPY